MGWLKDNLERLCKNVAGASPVQLTFVPSIEGSGIPGANEPIKADECYIELYLESLRLGRARRFASRFDGVVYSFVTMAREGEERAQLAAVSKPQKLTELDKNSLGRVITVSKQMMGATPYRGNPVTLELGLFSVKSGNVLTPVLDYITDVSSAAGISCVGVVKPFLPLITKGMDLITGQQQDVALEVGVDTDLSLARGSVAAIIDKPKESLETDTLSVDAQGGLVSQGKALDCGYAVFSLRGTTQKSDYGEIPELKDKYAKFQSALKSGKKRDAQDALTDFRFATIASPDLISSDARRLVQKAKDKLDEAFPPGGLAFAASIKAETLSEIGLYD